MSGSDTHTYPEPPIAGNEADTLLGSLERIRATFAWKCADLDAAGLAARVGASTLTLGGLLKHLALVEDHQFQHKFLDRDLPAPWEAVDWDAEPDWEWATAAADSPAELYALWAAAVQRSRTVLVDALAADGIDQLGHHTYPDGRTPSLRRLVVDMIEEYSRHLGHADLLRESVDGRTGEDPPGTPVAFTLDQ